MWVHHAGLDSLSSLVVAHSTSLLASYSGFVERYYIVRFAHLLVEASRRSLISELGSNLRRHGRVVGVDVVMHVLLEVSSAQVYEVSLGTHGITHWRLSTLEVSLLETLWHTLEP